MRSLLFQYTTTCADFKDFEISGEPKFSSGPFQEENVTPETSSAWWRAAAYTSRVEDLESLTVAYWEALKSGTGLLKPPLVEYTHNLLPRELHYADLVREAVQIPACHTLVLLVGHSPEPLLQAISVFQPQRLVLILSEDYGEENGQRYGEQLAEFVQQHLAKLLPHPPLHIEPYAISDQPATIFGALCAHVLEDRRQALPVIVDITGGKKSMVAGAFMFAVYADIPISYVDFDAYSGSARRPRGYLCRIGMLTNPYDAFRLRQWEQVQQLVENYHFRAACAVLEEINAGVQPEALLTPALAPFRAGINRLIGILKFYTAWDDGDYHQAHEMWQRLPPPKVPAPRAVVELGPRWPSPSTGNATEVARQLLVGHANLSVELFESQALLLVYARDELAKIERLVQINEDNRSTLLRAAGLDELLLKARLVQLWSTGRITLCDQYESVIPRADLPDAEVDSLYNALLRHQGTEHMRRALQRIQVPDKWLGRPVLAFVKLEGSHITCRLRPATRAPKLGLYDQEAGLAGQILTDLRNQAIHRYLSVPRSVAELAVNVARANLDDFAAAWIEPDQSLNTIAPEEISQLPWRDLCDLCDLEALPLALHIASNDYP